MSELVPIASSHPQEMRFQDQETGQWMVATVINGQLTVVAERAHQNSVIDPVVTQVFSDSQHIYEMELHALRDEQIAGHRAIRQDYSGKPFGKQRSDRAIYEFDRDVIRPKRLQLQQRHSERIEQSGHIAHDIATRLATAVAEQQISLFLLKEGEELREYQGQVAIDNAKGQVAVQSVHDSRERRLKEEELDRQKREKDDELERLVRLENTRTAGAVEIEKTKAEAEFKIAKLTTDKDIKIAKLNKKAQESSERESRDHEERLWKREDDQAELRRGQSIIDKAWSQGKYIVPWRLELAAAEAETPQEQMALLAQGYAAFTSAYSELTGGELSFDEAVEKSVQVNDLAKQLTVMLAQNMHK